VRFTLVCVVFVAVLMVSAPARGQTTSSAPGFTAGPRVLQGGLLWSGAGGVSMTSPAGVSSVVVPGSSLSAVVGDQNWIGLSGRSGVRGARLGRRLTAVALPRRCLPLESPAGTQPQVPLLALTGGDLYAVIAPSCVDRSRVDRPVLIRVPLPAGTVRVLARVPAGAATLTAAGSRLALTFLAGSPPHAAHVDVLNAATGRSLFTVSFTVSFPASELTPDQISTQLDSRGDVLLTGTFFLPPVTSAEGWWGNRRHRVGHVLDGLVVGANPEPFTRDDVSPAVAAALSDGLLAYATYSQDIETIAVRNLSTDTTRTVAGFPGSAGVLGIGLHGTHLAWAQQSLGYTTSTSSDPCVTRTHALGPVQLVSASIDASAPISEPGEPVPPRTGPLCPPPI
jgi:hypothetical protein